MTAPSIRATMERRILVNYRIDPDVLASVLPAPFRPALLNDAKMPTPSSRNRCSIEWKATVSPAWAITSRPLTSVS